MAALAVVLLAAFAVSRSCGRSGVEVSKEEAIAIAVKQLDFKPKCVQIRIVRQGIQSQSIWAVSLWTLDAKGQFDRVGVVQLNATTAAVLSVNEQPPLLATRPQCDSPV